MLQRPAYECKAPPPHMSMSLHVIINPIFGAPELYMRVLSLTKYILHSHIFNSMVNHWLLMI